jgi:eukaryotic-like serine/threonine-protein kinase
MAILPGRRLGPYEILSSIGAGGMGEVHQVHDTKLGRDVAIKVLPENFVNDPECLARFRHEAKMLAALNHPNIATIHGLEQSDGTRFLVMELVPGETLAERVKTGPLPVDEALKIGVQIAEALEAAHEKNIIHRDLKPANAKVTSIFFGSSETKSKRRGYLYGAILGAGGNRSHAISPQRIPARRPGNL